MNTLICHWILPREMYWKHNAKLCLNDNFVSETHSFKTVFIANYTCLVIDISCIFKTHVLVVVMMLKLIIYRKKKYIYIISNFITNHTIWIKNNGFTEKVSYASWIIISISWCFSLKRRQKNRSPWIFDLLCNNTIPKWCLKDLGII